MLAVRFTILLVALPLLLSLLVAAPATQAQTGTDAQLITLPGDTVFPEGIAYDARTGYFYVTSNADGTIFRGRPNDTAAQVFLPGGQDGRNSGTGLKVDAQGRLFVCGAATGMIFVYDTSNKHLLGKFNAGPTPTTFINDVALTPNGDAYFTDSVNPVLYRVTTNAQGQLAEENWLNFTGTALTYQPGFNLNGIAASADGRYLIVIQSNTGKLYRITVADKTVTPISVGSAEFTSGDGILLDGDYLHVMRNQLGLLVTVELNADYSSGQVVSAWTSPAFAFPTTFARAGSRLLVVNSQFNKRGPNLTPVLPFTVANVPAPVLSTPPGMPTTGAPQPWPLVLLLVAGLLLALGGGLRWARLRRS